MDIEPIGNEEISLKDLFVKAKKWYAFLVLQSKKIFLAGIIGAALGLTYSIVKKPVYKATLSFALEDEKGSGGLGNALGLASTLGLDLGVGGGGIFTSSNLTALFKSRSMVEKTLLSPVSVNGQVISLAEMYIKNKKWREDWEEKPKFSSIQFLPNSNRKDFTRVQDSIMGVMYNNLIESDLSVEQKNKKISIVNIDVSATDELFAKYFCEALAKQVSNFYVTTKSKKARINMAILQKQTDSIRNELNSAITGVAIANDNTFNLNPALNIRRTPSAKKEVDVRANTAILTELVKQSELAKVTLRRETPLIQVIDAPILPLPKERFGKAKGIILGGFLGGFFIIAYLTIKRLLKSILQ